LERTGATNIALRAAASGLVDYDRCRLHDHTWDYYYQARITALRLQDRHDRLQARYAYYLALVDATRFDVDKVRKNVTSTYDDLRGWQNPALGVSEEERQSNAEQDFREQWERIAGFSLDDNVQLEKWEAQLREHLENKKLESDEEQREESQLLDRFNEQVRKIREARTRRKPSRQ